MKHIIDRRYLHGDIEKFADTVESGINTSLFGVVSTIRHLCATTLNRPILYITPDSVSAGQAYSALSALKDGVYLFPYKYDYLTYKGFSVSDLTAGRVGAIQRLISGDFTIMVAAIDSLIHYFPERSEWQRRVFTVSENTELDYEDIKRKLVELGYERVESVTESRTFSIRGDVIDIFPCNSKLPYRIMLFDNYVESIKQFEPISMMTFAVGGTVTVLPCSDMVFSDATVGRARSRLKDAVAKLPFAQRLQEIATDIDVRLDINPINEMLWWLVPFVKDELNTVADYLPDNAIVFFDEAKMIKDKVDLLRSEYTARVKDLASSHEVLKIHADSLLDFTTLTEAMRMHTFVATLPPISVNPLFKEGAAFTIKTSPIPKYYMDRTQFVEDLKRYAITRYDVVLCLGDRRTAEATYEGLHIDGVGAKMFDGHFGGIMVTDSPIENGFNIASAKLVVIGRRELMHNPTTRMSERRKAVGATFYAPQKGDYVVHEQHGIGQCLGVQNMKVSGQYRDYVVVQYKGADKLYVPVEGMDRLSKYVASGNKPPVLNSLGGRQFEKTVAKVKESLKALSFNLLEVYAIRNKAYGFKYSPDNWLQEEFENSFPYEETYDQRKAIEDIKQDLISGKIMDRLLCGDVGYGKTEVALRAIFKVVQDGKQAVMLVPTTLLAIQHYNLMKERFADFGVTVEVLSRLQSPKETKNILERLKNGKIDVIVGTHRLLSKDVEFNELGLLVLDEEQRFGVEHKEQIKTVRYNLNVLSLSATPIPRTLNLALNGIRDISILDTPPLNRLPVETVVTEYSDGLVVDAVKREMARGGQVFILLNRVQKIDAYAMRLQEMLPGVRLIVAHGQMDGRDLESRMAAFYSKQADVLVCTTIIENGIDLPDANTLIVCDADKLGLAELYQLRGRVGRSNRLAYAYFTVQSQLAVTENGMKRLNAVLTNTELGSGFKIAVADLEIRGAGEILGAKQSGNIGKVGYDLYCKLLEEAVGELRGETERRKVNTEMIVDVDTFVPDDYADKLGGKLKLYKRIAAIDSAAHYRDMYEELTGVSRRYPEGVVNLMKIALLKSFASRLGATKVVINTTQMFMLLEDFADVQNEELIVAIADRSGNASLSVGKEIKVLFYNLAKTRVQKLDYFLDFATQCTQKLC